MNTTRLLITGVNGLVGSIVSSHLGRNYAVYGIDLKPPFSDRVAKIDVSEYAQLAEYVEKISPVGCVLHLAGSAAVDAPWDAVLKANIVGTRNVYEIVRILKIPRVVFASSNHVTGAYEGFEPRMHLERDPERITVYSPIKPDSDYGVSKAFGEALASYYCARWDIRSICLRIGSVRPDDDPRTHPRFAKTWLSHRDLIQLVEKSILARVDFGIYYGISGNRGTLWDISNARSDLGYEPLDDASEYVIR